jgi:Trk K+ transport system NAD-binding subunit
MPLRSPAAPIRRRYSLWRLARANFYDLGLLLYDSRVVLIAFGLLSLVVSLYLRRGYPIAELRPQGIFAALYETLGLMSLQSGLPYPVGDPLGEALFLLTPLLGLALILQGVLNFGRLLLDKGSRREAWQRALAATYREHVIVCGLGRVGLRIVTQLINAGYDPVVVERDPTAEFVERTIDMRVPVVFGDAREPQVLRQAGVLRARALVCAIDGDLANIEIALSARALRPKLRAILRIFNEELDRNLERTLGPHTAFSASALAAPTFAAAAVTHEIEFVIPAADQLFGVTQMTITNGHPLAGSLATIEQTAGVRVLAQHSAAGRTLRRSADRQLAPGDRVALVAPLTAIEQLQGRVADDTGAGRSVIVCGLGKVGYRVVRQLASLDPPPRIVVVRQNDERTSFVDRINRIPGVRIILGDARELAVLQQAGLDTATSIAALTSDDLVNLQIGLTAQRARPELPIVLRTFSDVLAVQLADMFGIRTTYSTSALAGPTLAAAAVAAGVRQALVVDGALLASDQILVATEDRLAGMSVGALRDRHGAIVLGVRHNDAAWRVLPPDDLLLAPGDTIDLLAPIGPRRDLRPAIG